MVAEMRRLSFDRAELIRVVADMLAIAKVAMPKDLFAIDPRVLAAQTLLSALQEGIGSGRVPTIAKTWVPHLGVASEDDPQTRRVLEALDAAAAQPPWDIAEGLDRFMAEPEAPAARSDAITMILRDWLIAHGYLEAGPAKDDAH